MLGIICCQLGLQLLKLLGDTQLNAYSHLKDALLSFQVSGYLCYYTHSNKWQGSIGYSSLLNELHVHEQMMTKPTPGDCTSSCHPIFMMATDFCVECINRTCNWESQEFMVHPNIVYHIISPIATITSRCHSDKITKYTIFWDIACRATYWPYKQHLPAIRCNAGKYIYTSANSGYLYTCKLWGLYINKSLVGRVSISLKKNTQNGGQNHNKT